MRRLHKLLAFGAVAALAVTVPVYAFAEDEDTSSKAAGTYADYSLMGQKRAGSAVALDNGKVATQWAWKPLSGGGSEIQWGDPAEGWPPSGGEHFERDGDWVRMTGYYDHANKTFNKQKVISESIGDANCRNMKPLATDGRQHYVKWTIPQQGYCLLAKGTITVGANGAKVNFKHEQRWSPPKSCQNKKYGKRTCIVQHETWWDDREQPFGKVLERDQYIAKGLGMAFRIDATYPRKWRAEMNDSWKY